LPKGEDFQCQIGTTTEEDADGRQECGYDAEHDSTFVATRLQQIADRNHKGLILMQYELLATHRWVEAGILRLSCFLLKAALRGIETIILRCEPIFGRGQARSLTKIQIASKL
jgi:hypothetical protein